MKTIIYTLLAVGSLLGFTSASVQARAPKHFFIDSPAKAERKAAARERMASTKKAAVLKQTAAHKSRTSAMMNQALRLALGFETTKAVKEPARLNRRLHVHEEFLKTRARIIARARRRHAHE